MLTKAVQMRAPQHDTTQSEHCYGEIVLQGMLQGKEQDYHWTRHGRETTLAHAGSCSTVTHKLLTAWLKLTKQLLDNKELINVTVPREQGLAINEFPHDAAHSPHVHFLAIMAAAQQQLWSPVPPTLNTNMPS